MSLPLIVDSVLGAALCGYCLGRARPWARLGDWAIDQVRFLDQRTLDSRWRTRLVFAAYFATQPRVTWHALRHRHDRPEPRSAAPDYDPTWTNRPTTEE